MTEQKSQDLKLAAALGLLPVLLAACLASAGCGLFDTREPETPGEPVVPWITPTAPETLFVNIKNAVEGKVLGNLERCLLETGFAFHPDPDDSLELLSSLSRDVFAGWNLDAELAVAQSMFDEASSLTLTFTTRDSTVRVDTENRVYYYKYELYMLRRVGSAETFRGLVDFGVHSVGGLWYVSFWLDKRNPDYPFPSYKTWGYLKGTKRSL